ncbi:hypothetical protein H4582DRAFT_2065653 [Lactarius indigo]|nr:hypothetical protein H4582DRAFT_2065653 [Lactarius indigo]
MPNTSKRCQYRFDPPLVTASTRGCSLWASRTGHNGIDPAMRAPVPKASERGSPHYDSVTAVGGGRPKVVRGRGWRKRHGTAFQGPPARRPGLARKGGDGTHLDDDDRERVYRASLHGQDLTDDRLATPVLPRLPLLRPTPGAKSGLTVNRRGSRTGHNDIDSATRALVPKASERGSPHYDSTTARVANLTGFDLEERVTHRHREKRERKLTWKGIQSVATENEARQANENESLRRGSNRIISATRQGGSMSTPTKTTRRHAKVAREGCHEEGMRIKNGKSLENLGIEDTKQEEGKGGGATNAPSEATLTAR